MEGNVHKVLVTSVNDTAGAVGVHTGPVQPLKWIVAIVRHGDERLCNAQFLSLGYETYLPTQRIVRRYTSGRKKKVDRLLLPAKVFVRTTEYDRLKTVVNLPVVCRFLVDYSRRRNGNAPVAVIPDHELEMFRRMLSQEDFPVSMVDSGIDYTIGEKVKVVSGKLAGLEGFVRTLADNKHRLYVSLDILGSAFVEIDKNFLEPVTPDA